MDEVIYSLLFNIVWDEIGSPLPSFYIIMSFPPPLYIYIHRVMIK